MNKNAYQNTFEEWSKIDCDAVDFDELESKLDAELEEQMADLKDLELDREKIGSPDSIGETVKNVVWEQFINQIGVYAGEDFIRENRGLHLDLRESAHIQTPENFENGKIATHNYISKEQLEQNYNRSQNMSHSEFRDKYVDPGMNATLERAGRLHDRGIETVRDIYTGKQIPTQTKLENGENNPLAAQREHVKSSSELYGNSTLQMAYGNEELASVINDPENLQGYTTAERNNRKSDSSAADMEERDRNKHWEKANERAEEHVKRKEDEGIARLEAEGRNTQQEEAKRIGGKALRAVAMALLASLVKDIIRNLIAWFRVGNRKLQTFIDTVKESIINFLKNIKQNLKTGADVLVNTVASAIFDPIIGTIKKAWIFLKQGYKSVKEAIHFLKDPANKNMPFGLKMMQVGKIVIAGLTAGGAIVLGEVIEKLLLSIPGFAFEIPLLGSLANIIGLFMGAMVSGIIGALALNLIDKMIAKRLKRENDNQQLDKKNEIISTQEKLNIVTAANMVAKKAEAASSICQRHSQAGEHFNEVKDSVKHHSDESERLHTKTDDINKDIANLLNGL